MDSRTDTEARRANKRARTAKACMHCRRRRIKCTGESPCASCIKLGRPCVYETGPKKQRVSHKGVITTLKAENQRLREDLQGLRMFSGLAGVTVSNGMVSGVATPKAEELPFVEAYLEFEEAGLFPLVGRARFAAVLASLHSHGSASGSSPTPSTAVPSLNREETALYFAMLAMGASLRRQEVPSMSYASRVRTILAESFDAPSETMVRVSLLLAILYGSMLDVAKEACYLSMALQMLAIMRRVTGRDAPEELVTTAASICNLADGPLPFTTPKDLPCASDLQSLSCLLTQVAGTLMSIGSDSEAAAVDDEDLLRAASKAADVLARVTATGATVPAVYGVLVQGLLSITHYRLGHAAAGASAALACQAAVPASDTAAWSHPVYAFVLRHVGISLAALGHRSASALSKQVHNVALAWPRAAVFFRGMQNDLRQWDDDLRARIAPAVAAAPAPTAAPMEAAPVRESSFLSLDLGFDEPMAADDAVAPAPGGSPPMSGAASGSMAPTLNLKGEVDLGLYFDMMGSGMDSMIGAPAPAAKTTTNVTSAVCLPLAQSREAFSYVQMVTLALGKPWNTCTSVLRAGAAPTRILLKARVTPVSRKSRRSRAAAPPAASPMMPMSKPVASAYPTKLALDSTWGSCAAAAAVASSAADLTMDFSTPCPTSPVPNPVPAAPKVSVLTQSTADPFTARLRRNSLSLLCDADNDDLEEMLFSLSPEELMTVSLA